MLNCIMYFYKCIFISFVIILYCPDCFNFQLVLPTSKAYYPRECKRPLPEVKNIHECCPEAMLFSGAIARSCEVHMHPKNPDTEVLHVCEYHKCIFKSLGSNVVNEDGTMNKGASINALKRWAEVNKKYDAGIHLAQRKCLDNDLKGFSANDFGCPFFKNLLCIVASLIMKCPNWTDSLICTQFRASLELCEQLYYERLLEYFYNSSSSPSDSPDMEIEFDKTEEPPSPTSAASIKRLFLFEQDSSEYQDKERFEGFQKSKKDFGVSDESEEPTDPVIFV